MSAWHKVASELDDMYAGDRRVARRQLKNQPQLLFLENTRHKFFPIRRLIDGLAGRRMNTPKSSAQEVQRYRHELRLAGFHEIVEGDPRHRTLLDSLTSVLRDHFHDRPSTSRKTFWAETDVAVGPVTSPSMKQGRELLDQKSSSAVVSPHPVKRLPHSELQKVTADHVRRSIDMIVSGKEVRNFSESTDYDVLLPSGERLAPKRVFALALAEVLEMEIFPGHFSAGLNQPCFEIIEAAGFHIVPKLEVPAGLHEAEAERLDVPLDDAEIVLIEGNPKIVHHLRRERAPGLARIKKRDFLRKYGELFCERCGIRPAAIYGSSVGESCIEIHHALTQVRDMRSGHKTKIEDLQCLCANCHRVTHREMVLGASS